MTSRAAKEGPAGVRAGAVGDREEAPAGPVFEAEWYVEGSLRLPSLGRLWREWRCSRKHAHGPKGFYQSHAINSTPTFNL